jgi:hypothetical protein
MIQHSLPNDELCHETPRAGLLKSHSPWYRRKQTKTNLYMSPRSRECDKSHNRILLAKALRTTRFDNGAEKVRKIMVTKPHTMAQKNKEELTNPDDLQQNEDERVTWGALGPCWLRIGSQEPPVRHGPSVLCCPGSAISRGGERQTFPLVLRFLKAPRVYSASPSRSKLVSLCDVAHGTSPTSAATSARDPYNCDRSKFGRRMQE